ncbi:MAG: FliH/SctL family protein [Gemmatales bacterium]|nr:flagellar assembly protein FliH [Gemmatales bacterium]MDW7995825.1 FliH/SctL family protein [Gemmatales bacterium]
MHPNIGLSEYVIRLPRRLSGVCLADNVPATTVVPSARESPVVNESNCEHDKQQALHWQHAILNAVQHLQHQVQGLRQALPRLAAELALVIFQETLGNGMPVPLQVWQKRLEEWTATLKVDHPITLALSPEDWQWWQSEAAANLRAALPTWKLVADPQLRPGEYRIEWEDLVLWWRWHERLAAVMQTVLSRVDSYAVE